MLRSLDPLALLRDVPEVCAAFVNSGRTITAEIEQAVQTYLTRSFLSELQLTVGQNG